MKGRIAIGGFIGQREGRFRRLYRAVGGCRGCGPLRLPHLSDEAEALARQCFDQALFLAGIADRALGNIKAGRQRRIGHAAPIPDGVDEVILADHALSIADQVIEQVEYLWRDGDQVRATMQLAPVGVECIFLEEIAHAVNPLGGFRWSEGSSTGCNEE